MWSLPFCKKAKVHLWSEQHIVLYRWKSNEWGQQCSAQQCEISKSKCQGYVFFRTQQHFSTPLHFLHCQSYLIISMKVVRAWCRLWNFCSFLDESSSYHQVTLDSWIKQSQKEWLCYSINSFTLAHCQTKSSVSCFTIPLSPMAMKHLKQD